MPSEREQGCAGYKCQIHTEPHSEPATLQIAAHFHDDRVDHEAMNDHGAQRRREPDEQETQYPHPVRMYHLARGLRIMLIYSEVPPNRRYDRPTKPALCSDIGGSKLLLFRLCQDPPDTKGTIGASWSSAG